MALRDYLLSNVNVDQSIFIYLFNTYLTAQYALDIGAELQE